MKFTKDIEGIWRGCGCGVGVKAITTTASTVKGLQGLLQSKNHSF